MKKRILLAALLAAGVAAALSAVLTRSAGSNGGGVANIVLSRQLSYELGRATAPRWAQHVSSGMMYDVLAAAGVLDQRANQVHGQGPAIPSGFGTQGCHNVYTASGIPAAARFSR